MLLWLVPLVTGVGYLAIRSWQQDAALRSGELMDVRDVLPDGEADLEVRALAARRYRLELQFESTTRIRGEARRSGRGTAASHARFPYRLCVEALGDKGPDVPLYQAERDLRDLFALASSTRESKDHGDKTQSLLRISGSVPLLEFESTTLGRMRFALSIDPKDQGTQGDTPFEAQLDKAWLILKEDVRPLRVSASLLDLLRLDLQERRVVEG